MAERQVMKDFIKIYRSEPCLWQVQSKEYHNRNLKIVAYSKLIEKLKLIDSSADREKVVKKINNLRTNYRKELKKVTASEKLSTGPEDVYVPTLWYFKSLQFLSDQEEKAWKPVNDISHIIITDVYSSETEVSAKAEPDPDRQTIAKFTSAGPTSPRPGSLSKKSKSSLSNKASSSEIEQFEKPHDVKQEDRFDIFGKNVAAKLRDIEDKTQRILAEKIINDALFGAEIGSLLRPISD